MTSASETSSPTTTSPLEEVDPAILDELFARDPMNLTNDDVDMITDKLRGERAVWCKSDENAKAKKERTPRGIKRAVPEGGLSIDDLGDLGL